MEKPYRIVGESIVETATSRAVMTLTLPKWEDSLKFTLKLMNGDLVPRWNADNTVVVFVPPSLANDDKVTVVSNKPVAEEEFWNEVQY